MNYFLDIEQYHEMNVFKPCILNFERGFYGLEERFVWALNLSAFSLLPSD